MSRTLKISTFDQAEELINRQATQINNLQANLNSVAKNARVEAQKEIAQKVEALRKENSQKEQRIINDLKSHTQTKITELEIKHRQAMLNQSDQFYKVVESHSRDFANKLQDQSKRFDNKINDIDATLRSDMKEQENKLRTKINDVRSETISLVNNLTKEVNKNFAHQQRQINIINKDINGIREDINALFDKEKDDLQNAKDRSEACDRILKLAKNNISIQKFELSKLNQLERRFQTLQDLKGNAQAIIANSTSLMNDIWDMEEEAQVKQLVFDVLYTTALTNLEALLQLMKRNRESTFFRNDKNEEIKDENGDNIKVEIDFWTKGEYSKLEEQILQLKQQLESNKISPSLNEESIKEILTTLSAYEVLQNELVTTSACRGLLSEERANMSENIINSLLDRGYRLLEENNGDPAHNYLGNEDNKTTADQREGIYAILENKDGVNITLLINPNEKLTSNSVIFQRNDNHTDNPDELKETISFIQKVIQQEGYETGDVASPKGTGDNKQLELVDANALKNKGISKELKKRMGITS